MKKLFLIAIAIFLSGCSLNKFFNKPEQQLPSHSDFCEMLKASIYSDGEFKFSQEEVATLSKKNKIKIASLKLYWKDNCLAK